MKRKLPERVVVGHLTFAVEVDNAHCEARNIQGTSDGNQLLIRLRDTVPKQTLQETLLHEVLHMAVFAAGLDADTLGQHGETGSDIEEALIRPLSMLLYGTLRDNPELISYLTERDSR